MPKSLSYFKYAKDQLKNGDYTSPNYAPLFGEEIKDVNFNTISYNMNQIKSQENGSILTSSPQLKIFHDKGPLKLIRNAEYVPYPNQTFVPIEKLYNYMNTTEKVIAEQKKELLLATQNPFEKP